MPMKNAIWVLILITSFSFAQEKANPDTVYNLGNCFNAFDSTKTIETKVGWQYWFVDKQLANGYTLKMSFVGPDTSTHAPHKHADQEIFYILEGQTEFTLGDEKVTAGPGSSLYCPPNILHGLRNIGNTPLKYLVIKQYLKKE
jgi:quercetin dioxygenase-like cupin family protein